MCVRLVHRSTTPAFGIHARFPCRALRTPQEASFAQAFHNAVVFDNFFPAVCNASHVLSIEPIILRCGLEHCHVAVGVHARQVRGSDCVWLNNRSGAGVYKCLGPVTALSAAGVRCCGIGREPCRAVLVQNPRHGSCDGRPRRRLYRVEHARPHILQCAELSDAIQKLKRGTLQAGVSVTLRVPIHHGHLLLGAFLPQLCVHVADVPRKSAHVARAAVGVPRPRSRRPRGFVYAHAFAVRGQQGQGLVRLAVRLEVRGASRGDGRTGNRGPGDAWHRPAAVNICDRGLDCKSFAW